MYVSQTSISRHTHSNNIYQNPPQRYFLDEQENTTGQVQKWQDVEYYRNSVFNSIIDYLTFCSISQQNGVPKEEQIWVLPMGGTLIGLLRYGALGGELEIPDVVDHDHDFMFVLPEYKYRKKAWGRFRKCIDWQMAQTSKYYRA